MKVPEGNPQRNARPGATAPSLLVGEIRAFDDERAAFPVAEGISIPVADVLADVRAPVGWDEAGVQPLTDNQHPSGRRPEAGAAVVSLMRVRGLRGNATFERAV